MPSPSPIVTASLVFRNLVLLFYSFTNRYPADRPIKLETGMAQFSDATRGYLVRRKRLREQSLDAVTSCAVGDLQHSANGMGFQGFNPPHSAWNNRLDVHIKWRRARR